MAKALTSQMFGKEVETQLAVLRKSNPELAAALEQVPKSEIIKLAKVRAAPRVKITQVGQHPTGPRGPLITPPPAGAAAAAEGAGEVVAKGAKFGGKAAAGIGLAAGILMPMFSSSPLTLPGRAGKAKELAVKGYAALGASSSSTALAEIVRNQELAARRQLVMQQFEPDMWKQTLNVLASTGAAPSSLTSSERQIGSNTEVPLPARRPDKDIKFLLDQLMSEASTGSSS